MKRILAVCFVIVLLVAIGCAIYASKMLHRGFSTRVAPGSVESSLAMSMRNMAIPSRYKTMKDPVAATPEIVDEPVMSPKLRDLGEPVFSIDDLGEGERGLGLPALCTATYTPLRVE